MPGTGLDDGGEDRPQGDGAVTILVVDDQESFRCAMRELVAATEGFRLVGEAASGEEALDVMAEVLPQMVIMDKRMPGMGGVEATRILSARHPDVVVLLVSVEEPNPQLLASCGAAAFARKQELSRTLLRDVWRAHGL